MTDLVGAQGGVVGFFTHYWAAQQVETQILNGSRTPLTHTAGNLFRARGVGSHDELYIINLLRGDVRIVARLTVEKVVDRREAQRILETKDLWPATDHAIAVPGSGTIARDDAKLLPSQLHVVEFILADGTTTHVKFNRRGRPDPNGVRGVRTITRHTAEMFDGVLER